MTPGARLETRLRARFAPPPRLTVADWADRYRILAPESSAEPGPWRTARTPYLREPLEAWTDPRIETLVIMASAQSGKTETALNALGRSIHLDPGPCLWVAPNVDPMARATSKDRIAPMLRLSPALAERVAVPRGRHGSATILHRTFVGGHLTIAGANAPASLASRPIRYLFLDEVDRYPPSTGGEGDPISLAVARTRTFTRRKIILVSSPKTEHASRIAEWYAISDQRRYWWPCPRCGTPFVPAWGHPAKGEWASVRWEGMDATTAYLECPTCHGRIEDYERTAMAAAGTWRPSAPFTGVAGWHFWEIYAPWRRLAELVKQYLDAQGSVELRQTFANTVEGRVWQIPAETLEPLALQGRRERWTRLPAGVLLLTAGIDVQDDRLELLIVGWGLGEEAWIVTRETCFGDPGRAEVWRDLDRLLEEGWPREDGAHLRVRSAFVDAAGHKTQGVYAAVSTRQARGVYACFGRAHLREGLVMRPKPLKTSVGRIQHRLIDTHQAKVILYQRLRMTPPGPETVHFPEGLGADFFDELTAERLVTRKNKLGVPERVWTQVRERNESLDAFVMALAALRLLAPTPGRLTALLARLTPPPMAMEEADAPPEGAEVVLV